MADSNNQNIQQTVTNRTELPEWYTSYLQQVMGRALTQAGDQTPPPTQGVAPLTPDQLNAYQGVRNAQGIASPYFNAAANQYGAATGLDFLGTAWAGHDDWRNAEAGLQKTAGVNTAQVADPYLAQAKGYLTGAAQGNALGAASPFLQQAVAGPAGIATASPFLGAAFSSFPEMAGAYMNPYTSAVTDRLAQLAQRNLTENLLPSVNDQFIRAGQYGSPQNRDLVGRALRDTQESLLGQQAQALEQGYGQAGQLYGQDAARYAQLAGTAGGLGTAQQQALLQAGSTTGGLSATDLARLQQSGINLGQFGLGAAAAQATDQARALAANQSLGQIGTQIGQLGLGAQQAQANTDLAAAQGMGNLGIAAQNSAYKDLAALEAAGSAQQGQGQANLNSLFNQQTQQYNLPWTTIGQLSNVIQGVPINTSGTTSSTTSVPQPSTLSQIGGIGLGIAGLANSGLFKAKGGAVRSKKNHSYGRMPSRRGLGFSEAA